jgi:hypothetical protein
MATITIELEKDRETKGTWRYAEVTDDDPVIGTLYVRKPAARRLGDPESLTVTITTAD